MEDIISDFSAMRPPLAASQTARQLQAVYDGTSLLVRRRTILSGGPDHAVGRCNCQTWSQICRIQFSCSATNYMSLRDRSFAAASPCAWNKLQPLLRRVYSPATFKRQLKTFLYNHAFNLIHIVRHPCCVSALTSPQSRLFR